MKLIKPSFLNAEKGAVPAFVIVLIVIIVLIFGFTFYLGSRPQPILPAPVVSPSTSSPSTNLAGNLPRPIELAKQDLAAIVNTDSSKINVISMDKNDWPDASLGCPKEGMMYAQVVTSGYKVILAYSQVQYEYHTDLRDQFVKCQSPQ